MGNARRREKPGRRLVDLMAGDAESTEADVGKEIEDIGKVQSDAKKTVRRVEAILGQVSPSLPGAGIGESSSVGTAESGLDGGVNVDASATKPVRAKLPKLEVKRFKGKSAIQRAHMQGLLKAERVRDERDIASLRRMCDSVETHYRGLEALGIEQSTYSAIVVPAILDRLPESVRLTITRGTDFHEWNMEELLTPLKEEVELREEHHEPERKSGREQERVQSWRINPTSAHAFFAKFSHGAEACAFCLGDHRHEECKRVENAEKRKEILRKYSRCFNCLKKGHLARN
jgi:hypothetical protein